MNETIPRVPCRNLVNLGLATAGLLTLGVVLSASAVAEDTALPAQPQKQSEATESVQPQVDQASTDKAAERREKIFAEATAALDETANAMQALDDEKPEEALAALERATGKLELILAREPDLALAPVDVEVVTYDLLASPDTVKAMIEEAEDYLESGEVQDARALMVNLASELQFRTTSIPLATYPDAIKAVTPLIDEGKLDAANAALQTALDTLVVTTEVLPLPKLRAERLLDNAEALAENEERTEKDNQTLSDLLSAAGDQLKLAELLGYGTKEAYQPMYEQLEQIKAKTRGGKGGEGWFEKIKEQLSDLL
jgi:hypothetical protein